MAGAVWRDLPAVQEVRDAYLDGVLDGAAAYGRPMVVEANARRLPDGQAQPLLGQADRLTGELTAERDRRAKIAASDAVPVSERAAAIGWLAGYASTQDAYVTANRELPWRRLFDSATRRAAVR